MSPQEREDLHQALRDGIVKGCSIRATLYLALKERVWEERVDEYGRTWRFGSFLEYLTARPPGGLYTTVADVLPLINQDPALLAMFDAETKRERGNPNLTAPKSSEPIVDNIHNSDSAPTVPESEPERPTGTSRQAAVRRLRKDRPDLLAKVVAGELSAHRGRFS